MAAVDPLILAGKDYFREVEAAEYCGLSLSQFREWYPENGVRPRRVGGRKLYPRLELMQAIERSPEWQPSTSEAKASTSNGRRLAGSGDALSERLRPERRREFVPRKKPN